MLCAAFPHHGITHVSFPLRSVRMSLLKTSDHRTRCNTVAPTTRAAGGRRASQTPAQTVKQCAWRGVGVDVKQARGFGVAARDPVDLACPHALRVTCLCEWQQSVVTPGQRALLDTRKSSR